MVLSDASRMLLIGLWTEADDQGVFEWKPLTLKARLRPANDGSVEPLLQEISDQNLIKKIEVDGKGYGLVRNFRKFQRPQKPNAIHPLPDEYRTYVGLVSDQSRTATGKSPQMEDVGCRREEKVTDDISATSEFDRLADSLWEAGGAALDQTSTELMVLTRPLAWLEAGCDLEADILPAIRAACARASPQRIRSWKYFEQPIADAKANRLKPMPEGRTDERTHHKTRDATVRDNHFAGILQAVAGARGT